MIPHMTTRYAAMLTAVAVLAPAAAAPAKTRYATAALLNHSLNARMEKFNGRWRVSVVVNCGTGQDNAAYPNQYFGGLADKKGRVQLGFGHLRIGKNGIGLTTKHYCENASTSRHISLKYVAKVVPAGDGIYIPRTGSLAAGYDASLRVSTVSASGNLERGASVGFGIPCNGSTLRAGLRLGITLDGKAHGRQTVKDSERSATLSWAGDHVNAGFGVGGCPTPSGQDGAGSFQAQLYPRS
jgi:hypothetical protein